MDASDYEMAKRHVPGQAFWATVLVAFGGMFVFAACLGLYQAYQIDPRFVLMGASIAAGFLSVWAGVWWFMRRKLDLRYAKSIMTSGAVSDPHDGEIRVQMYSGGIWRTNHNLGGMK